MINKLTMEEQILKGDYIIRTEEDNYTQMLEREIKKNKTKKILLSSLYVSILVLSLFLI